MQQKAQEVWHCVTSSNMNLKEIGDKFGFSSPSSLNNFFRHHFSITPGKARSKIKKKRE
jgi:transcriptional regulator GlxA family with amidase domain